MPAEKLHIYEVHKRKEKGQLEDRKTNEKEELFSCLKDACICYFHCRCLITSKIFSLNYLMYKFSIQTTWFLKFAE